VTNRNNRNNLSIGKYITAKQAYGRVLLELGGNDPLIVLDDAHNERATTAAMQSGHRNAGQRVEAATPMQLRRWVAVDFADPRHGDDAAGSFSDVADQMGAVIEVARRAPFRNAYD
jgi:acyl-CoA reductase-like NAD-dependent aldehyde dehydrogenase